VNIAESLDLVDIGGNGLLEKQDLKRALRNCQIAISDNELDTIYKEMGAKV
jgi:Ca2+-binding EF-hand superfamily protein